MEDIGIIDSNFLFHLRKGQEPLDFIPYLCPVISSVSRMTLIYVADTQKKKSFCAQYHNGVIGKKKLFKCLPTNLIDPSQETGILLAQE